MVSQEDLDLFLARVRRHGGRVGQLTARPSYDSREALLAALTELEMMYEDLLVADEELRVQGEELRASHATLAATQARYAELFAAAPVGYLVTTGEGIILESNRAATELLGNPPRGGLGKPLQVYIDPTARAELRRLMLNVWRGGGVAALDVALLPRTGRRVEVVVTLARAADPHGGTNTLRWGLTPPTGRSGSDGVRRAVSADGSAGGPAPSGPTAAKAAVPVAGVPVAGVPVAGVPVAGAGWDEVLLNALFEDASLGLLVVDADLRVLRAGAAFTGVPVRSTRLDELLSAGAETLGRLARACLTSGRPTQAEIDGRTRAEPDRLRRWHASAHPLTIGGSPAGTVGCLLVDRSADGASSRRVGRMRRG